MGGTAVFDAQWRGAVLALGGLGIWALGLYVVSRESRRRTSVLAALAMACLAIYLLGEALGALASEAETWVAWIRRTWWAPSIAAPAWLALSLELLADEGLLRPRWAHTIGSTAIAIGVVFGVAGVLTLTVQDWSAPYLLEGERHITPGPLLPYFQVFALVCVLWPALNVTTLWRASQHGSPVRARWAWLTLTAALFLVGGGWIVIGSGVYLLVGLPGQVLLVVGMLILGWNMARYGALLSGEQVLSDFIAFAATILAILALYGAIMLTLAPDYSWLERGIPLLLLVMTTHVVVDTRGHVLDRVLYAPLLGTLRGQLRELGNRVVRQPDELSALADVRDTVDQILRERTTEADAQTPKSDSSAALRMLVEGALRHLNDLPALSEHPLLLELDVEGGTPLERAAELRGELERAIERLRPASGARPTPGTSAVGGWLHYLVLREAYVDGRPNKQIMQRYAVSESTFHRARRRAIDALAIDLTQRTATPQPTR